ncbi:hypothetical protein [Paenibacillus brevis]|nr:hypothetical protein [Paenibacillus brevis]
MSFDTSPPGLIVFSGKMSSDRSYEDDSPFEISIEWNPDIYKDMQRTIALNQTGVIEGHSFTLNNLVLTPIATTLSVHTEPQASTGIEGFINSKLILDRKQEGQFRQAIYPRNSEYRYIEAGDNLSLSRLIFDNIYYRDITEITFQASGITLNSRQPFEIIMDTVEKQIKSAPPNFTLLSLKENNAQEVELQLRYSPSQPDNPDLEHLSFDFNRSFLDQEGNQHRFLSGDYLNRVAILKFDALSYPQLLTFTGKQITKKQIKHSVQWDFPFVE